MRAALLLVTSLLMTTGLTALRSLRGSGKRG